MTRNPNQMIVHSYFFFFSDEPATLLRPPLTYQSETKRNFNLTHAELPVTSTDARMDVLSPTCRLKFSTSIFHKLEAQTLHGTLWLSFSPRMDRDGSRLSLTDSPDSPALTQGLSRIETDFD